MRFGRQQNERVMPPTPAHQTKSLLPPPFSSPPLSLFFLSFQQDCLPDNSLLKKSAEKCGVIIHANASVISLSSFSAIKRSWNRRVEGTNHTFITDVTHL